jgi:hypothetical protein
MFIAIQIYFNIKGLKSVYGINQLGIVLSNVSTASLLKIVLPLDTRLKEMDINVYRHSVDFSADIPYPLI